MALAVPQTAHTAPTSGTPTVTATLLSATVVGNVLVAVVSGYDAAPGPTSVTDSRGNTWVRDYTTAPVGGGLLWYAVYSTTLTAAGTPHTVTFTETGVLIANLDVAEVSGMAASGRFEAAVLGGATGVSPYTAGPTGTLTQAEEIVFAAVAIDSGEVSATLTQDVTWVLIGEQQDGSAFIGSVVYKIVAATTPVTHVWTGTYASAPWSSVILSYKAAAAGPVTGTLAVTEAADIPAIAGTVTAPAGTFTGTIAVTEAVDTPAIAGTVTNPAPPTFRYPVAVSGRKFVDQLGGVYLVKDISSWAMCQNLTNAQITQALEGAAARHFNSVNVAPCGVNVFPGSYHPYTNATGQAFFVGAPFKTAFGAGWASMDWLVDECARLGMTVICSMFGSYDDVTGISNDLLACTVAECRTYGLTLANRYITDLHVMWHVEGEAFWDAPDSRGQRYDAIFHGIVDAYTAAGRTSPPLIIAEPTHTSTANSMFISRELRHGYTGGYQWLLLSANSLYQYATDSTVQFDNVWNEAGATTYPVWDCEPTYVGANRPSAGAAENQNIRERCYTVMLRGGIGINYGDEAWWPFDSPGLFSPPWTWQEAMGRQPELEAQRCWDLVDLYCADATWVPDNTSLTTGLGSGDDKAAVGHSNTALLAYFPTSRAVTVDTTVIAGTGNVRLRWYDPVLGTYATIAATEAQNAARVVTYPGNHADGFADYVLVVDAADTASGTIAVTEGPDVAVITGTVAAPTSVIGTIAVTEAVDTPAIVGTITTGPVTGTIAATEANDAPVIVGFIPGAPTEPSGALIVTVQAWPPPLTVEVTQP